MVEVYLENRAPGETGEDWFIDGQLVNPKKLLEEVSADQPHFEAGEPRTHQWRERERERGSVGGGGRERGWRED